MDSNDIKCGIVGIGLYFPETFRTYQDIALLSGIPEEVIRDKFGIEKIYYPGNNEQPSWMAVQAAKRCLEKTGIDPKEIDLIIYFWENYADHPVYSIGPKVQSEIKAVNAWTYDMECKCGSSVVALDQAKKYIARDEDVNTVMLVGGYRNVDKVDYKDKNVSFLFDVSCGGAALIVKRGHNRHVVLENANMTDGTFADSILIPGGGTKIPFTPENIHDNYLKYFRLEDPQGFRERLGAVTLSNLSRVTAKACKKSGLSVQDIDFVCLLHMKVSAHKEFLGYLNVPLEKAFYLSEFGHLGQLDVVVALGQAEERKLIKEGDAVALVCMGLGYSWNASIVRW
jgi:3-oxoacyl-[acyl-carrier-protein] synthase-3